MRSVRVRRGAVKGGAGLRRRSFGAEKCLSVLSDVGLEAYDAHATLLNTELVWESEKLC